MKLTFRTGLAVLLDKFFSENLTGFRLLINSACERKPFTRLARARPLLLRKDSDKTQYMNAEKNSAPTLTTNSYSIKELSLILQTTIIPFFLFNHLLHQCFYNISWYTPHLSVYTLIRLRPLRGN